MISANMIPLFNLDLGLGSLRKNMYDSKLPLTLWQVETICKKE